MRKFYITDLADVGWVELAKPVEELSMAGAQRKVNDKNKKMNADDAMQQAFNDLVYPEAKYMRNYSPFNISQPSPEVMLRIMRAALYVERPEQLIFHSDNQ